MATNTSNPAAAEAPRPPVTRPVRPNYNLLHKDPLPLKIDALPPLIPHNPLSLLAIAWVYFRSLVSPSKQPVYKGYFSPETRSVHVIDKVAIRALWESGFFGKGTLSRSEPTWLNREKQRRGIILGETSEDVTRRRREERARFKQERARKEREDIEATLKKERAALAGTETAETLQGDAAVEGGETEDKITDDNENVDLGVITNGKGIQVDPSKARAESLDAPPQAPIQAADEEVPDLEHLQLCLEEAFFLHFALGVLDIYLQSPDNNDIAVQPISRADIFQLFQSSCIFNPNSLSAKPPPADNTFLANYAVYHHFRSLGWIVRPGTKFAVDWMLYNRGPVFSHAEFAVIVVPSFSHPAWKTAPGHKAEKHHKSWHWLHMVNRVQSQVRKTLVLAFVEILPHSAIKADDPVTVLAEMRVREIVLKRWIPNRNRD